MGPPRLGQRAFSVGVVNSLGGNFVRQRHLYSRINFKFNRAAALAEWVPFVERIDLGCASNLMRVLICLAGPLPRLCKRSDIKFKSPTISALVVQVPISLRNAVRAHQSV